MSPTQTETHTDSPHSNNTRGERSYVLEFVGAVAVIGFFVGIFLAYRTQASGVVTQSEFDQLQTGQSVAVVNELLGFEGALVPAVPSDGGQIHSPDKVSSVDSSSTSSAVTYVWENSTISFVRCEFIEDRLTNKTANDLP